MNLHRRMIHTLTLVALLASSGFGQSNSVPPQDTKSQATAQEITTHESAPVFRVRLNQVLLKVIVRHMDGNTVKDLRREEFEIRDNGKPQAIASFSTERRAAPSSSETATSGSPDSSEPAKLPERYIAYLFDDLNIENNHLVPLKLAAERHLATLSPQDRAAVFTTSGHVQVEFTQDRDALLKAVRRLQRNGEDKVTSDCPWMTYYFADLIANKQDQEAIALGLAQTIRCKQLKPNDEFDFKVAQNILRTAALEQVATGEHATNLSLISVKTLASRMTSLPGQRIVVMASPGYLVPADRYPEVVDVIDRALDSDVVVHTLDPRGLYTDPLFDVAVRLPISFDTRFREYVRTSTAMEGDVLRTMAWGTGGTWFHANDDLELGFHRLAAPADFTYSIAFNPSELKFDGSFHKLSVKVKRPGSYNVFTRAGYRAPSKSLQAEEAAQQEVQETFFAREETQGIPFDVSTQFFKSSADAATLEVVTRVNLSRLPFRKESDRNLDRLIVVAGLFDSNGRYVQGTQKTVDLRLRDQTLQNELRSGISLKSRFKVQSGGYFVRVVVRDSEGQLLSAKNSSVKVP